MPATPADGKPRIIVHYHLYKTAGSTVLQGLRRHVGAAAFMELDKDPTHIRVRQEGKAYTERYIAGVVAGHPGLRALTAHYMVPDIHLSPELDAFPIVFLRHPLLRAMSVYRFERRRDWDSALKQAAVRLDAPAWLDWCIDMRQTEGRNYQTSLLSLNEIGKPRRAGPRAAAFRRMLGPDVAPPGPEEADGGAADGPDLATAIDRLDAVPVVGIVEAFDRSLHAINRAGKRFAPDFQLAGAHVNATKTVRDWRAELREAERALPADALARFYAHNADDLLIWERYFGALVSPDNPVIGDEWERRRAARG